MNLETNIEKIKAQAQAQEKHDWLFRCFVKHCYLDDDELDAIVHSLHEQVAAQIDCQTCGNCCREVKPTLDTEDVKRLASHLSLTEEALAEKYLGEDERDVVFRSTPCPFLSENSCSVYSCRPEACRSYPHLDKPDFRFRLNGALMNCGVCPIVFNVWEQLKVELHERGATSFFEEYEYEGE